MRADQPSWSTAGMSRAETSSEPRAITRISRAPASGETVSSRPPTCWAALSRVVKCCSRPPERLDQQLGHLRVAFGGDDRLDEK